MNLMAENFLITPCMLNVAIFFLPVPPAWPAPVVSVVEDT